MFDAATTAGDYVQISSTTAETATMPAKVIRDWASVRTRAHDQCVGGKFCHAGGGSEIQAPSAGNVNMVFSRSGTITAQSGDYSVGQVTGRHRWHRQRSRDGYCATVGSSNDSTKIATTASVNNQGFGGVGGSTAG